jgi:hypothetical protein
MEIKVVYVNQSREIVKNDDVSLWSLMYNGVIALNPIKDTPFYWDATNSDVVRLDGSSVNYNTLTITEWELYANDTRYQSDVNGNV